MHLNQKISTLILWGNKIKEQLNFLDNIQSESGLQLAINKAYAQNNWFTPHYIKLALHNICDYFLAEKVLQSFVEKYDFDSNKSIKKIGLAMAGNIPLVGFHDLLCILISPHQVIYKPSQKDTILLDYILEILFEIEPAFKSRLIQSPVLKNADAYIATGSDASAQYFEYYFKKYPSIIRKNRNSIAVLTGDETATELALLADDIMLYFGLGCRNVSQIWVPDLFNFENFLAAFDKYQYYFDHYRYKSNFDYQLTLAIMNKQYYMCNSILLMLENNALCSAISTLHYQFYKNENELNSFLNLNNEKLQCVVGKNYLPFGSTQTPGISDFADNVDTMAFLLTL